MIPCREGKSKFFVSVGNAVVKPDFAGGFLPGDFRRRLLSQGLPGFHFWGNGSVNYPPKAGALPTALHPDIQFFCMIPCREGKSKFFVSVGGAVVKAVFRPNFVTRRNPANARVSRLSWLRLLPSWIARTVHPNHVRYQLRYTRIFCWSVPLCCSVSFSIIIYRQKDCKRAF